MESEESEVCKITKVHKNIVKEVQDKMLEDEEFTKLGNLYSVFSDPMRIKIIFALFEHDMCVCDISEILHASQSNISHHLSILKANDLVSFKKQGKQVIYSLKDEHVKAIFFMGLEHIREMKD
jgi:ArsR family transcriptional regulator, lead/cadmium/zinc/bismuth-responsive transcriptional repressor